MRARKLVGLIVALVAAWISVQRNRSKSSAPTAAPVSQAPAASAASTPIAPGSAGNQVAPRTQITRPDIGFRSTEKLDEHFAKHGAEFGNITKAEYLRRAQELRDADATGPVLEIVRAADGVVSRFDQRSGAFEAIDRDGTIRTFFKPNDGESYFRRQAKRRPAP